MSNNPDRPRLSRRAFLNRLCLGSAAAWMTPAAAPAGAQASERLKWIDVHHHFIPPGYRDFFLEVSTHSATPVPMPPTHWELTRDLEDLDRLGSAAILSMFVPPTLGTPAQRASLARRINEGAAQLVRDHPGRFGSFAALPLPDVDASLAEIAYAAESLHADGFAVYTNVGDRWLGDPSLEPVLAELHRRRAVVFIHPTTAQCCANLVKGIPDNIIEYAVDTTRAIASLIFNGVTTRYANVRFIFSHGGGTVPFLIERFLGGTSAEIVPGIVTSGQAGPYVPKQPPDGALAELRKCYFDTAQCANPLAMRALRTLVPVEQILFGSDYFYRGVSDTAAALQACAVFDTQELQAIGGGNARRLIGRLA